MIKKAIVTGGAGFIGSHLAEGLLCRGWAVTIFDDLSTGRMENIAGLLNDSKVDFVEGSITSLTLLRRVFKGAQFVFHQAAIPSVPRSIAEPLTCYKVNATGTLNVLLAARSNDVQKVIYASSSSVYGDTPTLPKKEDMPPDPLSPYAASKLSGEYYCRVFHHVYGLPTVCLRYFNVYGPGQDPNSQYAAVVPMFISNSSEGKPPVIFGDGEQTRDFTFVKDVVAANILAAESDSTGVFNIGGGESITINRLAELITMLVGGKAKPIHQETRPGDVRHSLADISKSGAFGFKPEYALKAGLSETIRWFNDRKIANR